MKYKNLEIGVNDGDDLLIGVDFDSSKVSRSKWMQLLCSSLRYIPLKLYVENIYDGGYEVRSDYDFSFNAKGIENLHMVYSKLRNDLINTEGVAITVGVFTNGDGDFEGVEGNQDNGKWEDFVNSLIID